MYRSSLVFARALAILLLSCPFSFAVRTRLLLPCALQCVFMITVAFCGHLPLRRCSSADAVISTGGFPSAACTVLHIHAIYCRAVAVLFFAAFFDLFCVFYANCYGKDCVSVIFLVFLPLPAKLSAILLFSVSDTVRYMRLCGPTAGGPDAVVVNLRRLQCHLCIVLLPNKNAGRIRCRV